MKRIIFVSIIYSLSIYSVYGIPKKIRNAFTYQYGNTYTGIDTLININGYYSNLLMFYDNGLVVAGFGDYNDERFKNKSPQNIPLFFEEVFENVDADDSKFYYNVVYCGGYVIHGDTIKLQIIHKSRSWNDAWSGRELWYKIIDKNTLQCVNDFLVTTDQKEKDFVKKNYPSNMGYFITFIPTPAKPRLDYYWILREKWFWCNKEDWKAHMEKMKQREK